MNEDKTPSIYQHTLNSFRNGKPQVLTYDSNKENQAERRKQSLKNYPSRASEGLQADEYPYASTKEGGEGADVAYVPASENRSQGGSLGGFGGLYRTLKNGDQFLVLPVPKDKEPDAVPEPETYTRPIPIINSRAIDRSVKPATTTGTIILVIIAIILSPIGI
ncbi:NucA/NucB deoxyribonuclease domain-containing protein [Flavobacterium bizetiae]|uniref:NucA/NucB deoxyribonuclease domain-containing protein n=1 Tax=Flavobacterium bizetiae TaxID=2704140 RepID=UPI0037582A81